MRTFVNFLSLACAGVLFLIAAAQAGEIGLFAAASLKEVVTDLSIRYQKDHGDVSFRKNFGASGALAVQIEHGAPADLFISANGEWMDYLQARNLVDPKSRSTFACNELVFAGATTLPVAGMKDLARLRKIAIGSPRSVPAGEYAMESIRAAGIEEALAGKLVMARDVREAMMYAELGEVDGAFVYRTDAVSLGKRSRILFTVPEGSHGRVTYPSALTAPGSGKEEARAFLRFLQGPEAKKVLENRGFAVK